MDWLRVRTYNVLFGDAVLISIPERSGRTKRRTRHVLIDVGNVLSGVGGDGDALRRALENVRRELRGRPLDLYVMTHEHMDHVQGPLWGAREGLTFRVDTVWMTASAEGDAYYRRFPEAKRRFDLANASYWAIRRQLRAAPGATQASLGPLMMNNDPRRTNECVEYIRKLAPDRLHYVYRGYPIEDAHSFRDARFEIWAPEQDTSAYYDRFQPFHAAGSGEEVEAIAQAGKREIQRPAPPPGVDAEAFHKLIDHRERGVYANALAIDKARNNSSLVFLLEWRGWRLLFTGDAEIRSWKTMAYEEVLRPVHFLKVSHHGSHNGTPAPEWLDRILPLPDPEGASRYAVVSTCAGTYNRVPHGPTCNALARRCELVSTEDYEDWVDVEFPGA